MNSLNLDTNYLIIDTDIVELTLARDLKGRYLDVGIAIVKTESNVMSYNSGLNGDVSHARFFYTAYHTASLD